VSGDLRVAGETQYVWLCQRAIDKVEVRFFEHGEEMPQVGYRIQTGRVDAIGLSVNFGMWVVTQIVVWFNRESVHFATGQ